MLIVLIAISSNPSVAVTEGGQVWSLIFCLVNVGKNNGFVKLEFSTLSYHNSTNIGPISMFFTKN